MKADELLKVKDYLENKNIIKITNEVTQMHLREQGKIFSLEEHIKGLIYSLMSAQTVWANIERNKPKIDRIFFDYQPDRILAMTPDYFVNELGKIKCRSRLTNNQMKVLHYNIGVLQMIIREYGSMDSFVTSRSAPEIAMLISDSNSKYKLKQVGLALACEYLRNVGIDCIKPDLHLKRILGSDRLAISRNVEATFQEIYNEVKKLSIETGLKMGQIDYIIWAYCATEQGEVCTANPSCGNCVIADACKKIV